MKPYEAFKNCLNSDTFKHLYLTLKDDLLKGMSYAGTLFKVTFLAVYGFVVFATAYEYFHTIRPLVLKDVPAKATSNDKPLPTLPQYKKRGDK